MGKQTISTLERCLIEDGRKLETATFGMGCFWGPDARFGSLPGVIRTRTGYAGGSMPTPSYRRMGDHTETLQVEFDPHQIRYEDLLREFWWNHYPNRDAYKGRQYISLLFWHSEEQRQLIVQVKEEREQHLNEPIETEIRPYAGFTEAEERHQKYYLKRYPKAMDQLAELYPEEALLTDSAFAARLNGFVKGFGNRKQLMDELDLWKLPQDHRIILQQLLLELKW
ncbi:peptide-methionine (S)-S-oxide reductase MsrA [Planococcus sp. ISL-109]|uniref:peptide-methionine (S)-S-oxide reductase MsrA n=1 Tax=Planococcus sp. ISL-109 TaxID=2819166 RepID=UPI001BEB7D42|nr:peptide-methionine (S)-S-oxide reductase MsrA [Planococcus sp. ISL-109]MBT2582695.1 peptide-methionine (S)-S-oxide reductase MsrA [Planococcus sp. ISL-109]